MKRHFCFTILVFFAFFNILKGQDCYVSAYDPIANNWGNEKRAIVRISFRKDPDPTWIYAATGVLIMNTNNINTPYILTAYHLLYPCNDKSNILPGSLRFEFTYSGEVKIGATLVAGSADSDFALLKLIEPISMNSGICYAGWDSRPEKATAPIVILHHPAGNAMSYSAANFSNPIFHEGDCMANCWRILLDIGATTGGSSGAPYFNANHRIVAQHHKYNDNSTCSKDVDGGKFSISYSRLQPFLDPQRYGYANTTSVGELLPESLTISGPSNCSSSTVYQINMNGLPNYLEANWSTDPVSSQINLIQNGVSCTLQNNGYFGTISLICSLRNILNNTIVQTATKSIQLSYPPNFYTVYPSFITGGTTNWLQDNNCLLTYQFPGMYSGQISITNGPGSPPITNVTWTKIWQSPGTSFAGIGGSANGKEVTVTIKPLGKSATFRMLATNGCGSFSHDYTFTAGASPMCSGIEMMMAAPTINVYPNPTNGVVNIDYNSKDQESGIKEIELSNSFGVRIFSRKYNFQKTITLDISKQKPGIYFLKVYDGKERTSHQISVKK